MFFEKLEVKVLGVALALTLSVVPVVAQTAQPESQPEQQRGLRHRRSAPWLVTIVFELNVKDLIDELQAQGYRVSSLSGQAAESQFITNITSGLVISPSGRILTRLANFRVQPEIHSFHVLTRDGRRLKPKSCEYDPASGYVVLEVPDLAIQPPTFASLSAPARRGENLRLLYQVPSPTGPRWRDGRERPSRVREEVSAARAPRSKTKREPSWTHPRIIEDSIKVVLSRSDGPAEAEPSGVLAKKLSAPDGSIVLNRRGQVIGLMELLGPTRTVVKPITALRDLADRLVSKTRRGWLGVRVAQLSGDEGQSRRRTRAAPAPRLVVKEVFPNSPAAEAKLEPADAIRSFNGQVMKSLGELSTHIAHTPIGQSVPLEIIREGQLKRVMVKIAPRPRIVPMTKGRRKLESARFKPARLAKGQDNVSRSRSVGRIDRLQQLGLVVEPLDESPVRYARIFGSRGVLVTEVVTTGLAGRAGLRAGDVIKTASGVPVADQQQLLAVIGKTGRSGKVKLVIERRRHPLQVTLDLSELF